MPLSVDGIKAEIIVHDGVEIDRGRRREEFAGFEGYLGPLKIGCEDLANFERDLLFSSFDRRCAVWKDDGRLGLSQEDSAKEWNNQECQ
ncbi:hypothetical protein FEM03_15560 [Phragmitibacter flavus]|uniref:Uncharacterized protein n=1 Tax=Phragmitibacter flavus TaxID=2576071 RepID=A0A5R8KBR0_9BACT|nr:hypothetical protein [Phragmitibacter flavus]TLD69742.1 hypothetical protein FEM03_15560 [Phragmitibacter flavus]